MTHSGHDIDRGNGRESGDQAVFDSGRASLVFEKSGQGRVHLRAPSPLEGAKILQRNLKLDLHGACAVLPQQSFAQHIVAELHL